MKNNQINLKVMLRSLEYSAIVILDDDFDITPSLVPLNVYSDNG